MSDETTLTQAERTTRLVRHLLLAAEYGRAAILLVAYRSEFVRAEVERALLAQLAASQQEVVKVRVRAGQPTGDIPAYLAQHPASGRAIFFIYDVGQGGEATLQFLNYRRELLVEGQQRLVLWLTEGEFVQVARQAPDFFAFRGRTIEFLEPPDPTTLGTLTEKLTYYDWDGRGRQDKETRAVGIRLRENLLAELPPDPTFDAQRAELLYALAGEYQQYGEPERALALCTAVAAITPAGAALYTRLQNTLGNVYHDLGRHEEALAAYQQAIALDPKFALPHNGRGNVYRALGRHEEALSAYQQAIALDPTYALPHNGRGTVYRDLGRHEEALSAYQQAITLDSQNGVSHTTLAGLYRQLGQETEYQKHIEIARGLMAKESEYNRACFEAIVGNHEEALTLLAQALAQAPSKRLWAQQDPDFASLRQDPRFQALVNSEARP